MSDIGKRILRLKAHAAALLAGLVVLVTPAHAVPAGDPDPVLRLLAERGLLPLQGPLPQVQPAVTVPPVAAAAPPAAQSPGLVGQARGRASDMIITAMDFLGVPYRMGGDSAETGFDCSGFTRHIFELSLGLVLPRRADDQARASGLVSIGRDELRPGDLVFFNTLRRTFSHVGIYVGEGKFIHAPRSGGSVRVEDMRIAYWNNRFTGARRVEAGSRTDVGSGQR